MFLVSLVSLYRAVCVHQRLIIDQAAQYENMVLVFAYYQNISLYHFISAGKTAVARIVNNMESGKSI